MVQCPDRIIASIDTGVDDALALAYLLGSTDECELGGVIASYGNVDANTAYANTCAVLDLFGRADIPVFLGSEHPSWADAFIPDAGCAQFHGDDGLGNTRLAGSGALADGACVPGDDMSVDVPDEVVSVGGGCSCSSGVGCLFSCEPLSVGGPSPVGYADSSRQRGQKEVLR